MNIKSLIHNLFIPDIFLEKSFTKESLQAIQLKISEIERLSSIQIVFAYQVHRKLIDVLKNTPVRNLALREFAKLGVWDTENNSGILFYLLLADKNFEIVIDRGISQSIPNNRWQEISDQIQKLLKTTPIHEAVLRGIELINTEVASIFPAPIVAQNELGDIPIKI